MVPPPALKDCAATQLAVMTARARAGQLFLLGVPANALGGVEQQITADGPAGVFLTGHTTVGTAALARQTAELQRVATAASGGSGLFLATDQEGGQVQVLRSYQQNPVLGPVDLAEPCGQQGGGDQQHQPGEPARVAVPGEAAVVTDKPPVRQVPF